MPSPMMCEYVDQLNNINKQLIKKPKNRYQELIRVNRQMRKLEVSKRFGEIYRSHPALGSLSFFCPSCPQPGINLPPNWQNLPSWVTRRTITVDGNFHADHIKMRRPDLDIKLTDGQGYMVEEEQYQEYLSVAKEPVLVRSLINCFLSLLTCKPEDILSESPGCHCCQFEQSPKSRCYWCCCQLLRQTWLFHPNFCL